MTRSRGTASGCSRHRRRRSASAATSSGRSSSIPARTPAPDTRLPDTSGRSHSRSRPARNRGRHRSAPSSRSSTRAFRACTRPANRSTSRRRTASSGSPCRRCSRRRCYGRRRRPGSCRSSRVTWCKRAEARRRRSLGRPFPGSRRRRRSRRSNPVVCCTPDQGTSGTCCRRRSPCNGWQCRLFRRGSRRPRYTRRSDRR